MAPTVSASIPIAIRSRQRERWQIFRAKKMPAVRIGWLRIGLNKLIGKRPAQVAAKVGWVWVNDARFEFRS